MAQLRGLVLTPEGRPMLAKFIKWLSAWKLFKALRRNKPDQES